MRVGWFVGAMSNEELLRNMRERAARCRWLAQQMTDQHAKIALAQIADEAEADLRSYEARQSGQDNDPEQADDRRQG